MATNEGAEVYDLLILVDATYSMFSYLESLKTSLPKVIAISNLTNSFSRIGLLAYRDYSESNRTKDGMLEWSGWYDQNAVGDGAVTSATLMTTAASLEPIGGGDFPEATKTGLAKAYSLMREEATTIVLLYTDAPPHCYMVADRDDGSNYHAEQAALKDERSYEGFGPRFVDWVSACQELHRGCRKAHVFCFLDENLCSAPCHAGYYIYLSTITRGACLFMTDSRPHSIAQTTVDILLAWMGTEKAGVEKSTMPAKLIRYKDGANIRQIKDERDPVANTYFWAHTQTTKVWQRVLQVSEESRVRELLAANIAETQLDSDLLKKYLPKRKTPVEDFAQRYAKDAAYKKTVVGQLKSIIEDDVTSMSLNPVFGALWRAVCNDRDNPARDELITTFSLHVDKIANAEEKARMKNWLEESYDYAAEILETLNEVREADRFPCVFLDPTIEFKPAKGRKEKETDDEENSEDDRSITAFRRDELLEIGRSCDGRILRRLGKVLTRITYVESAADLPAHIAATTNAEVPKIPLALASGRYKRKFWKVLLHLVLPGTMLAARPATVLAALAIRIGLKPLFSSASSAMLFWRDKWKNLEVPETWNASCLGLLLDADSEYRKQMKATQEEGSTENDSLLFRSDRELFSRLVDYQHAGANLLRTLSAQVGWTPEKTQVPIGPVVSCRGCNFPRSVTIMAEKSGGKCGLCLVEDWTDPEHKERCLAAHVTKEDTEASNATWVECSMRTCRAQYVCYNVNELNVRPKCHYCRLQPDLAHDKRSDDTAPTLECTTCLNKIIWPKEWRFMTSSPFRCTACVNGRQTITTVETNAELICRENGNGWLLRNDDNVLKEPFKRSLFWTITTSGSEAFVNNVEVLPTLDAAPALSMHGKLIRNQADVKTELKTWIRRRTRPKDLCSLCFNNVISERLLPACRRRGCHQQICEGCLNGWYGLNSPGSIINTAALFCPFCRRAPAARTLAAYGMGIHAVGDLKVAVEESGQWIHAWCYECGKARRYMERVCARGAPDAIEKWKCESCNVFTLEDARIAEQEAQATLDMVAQLPADEQNAARIEALARLQDAQKVRKQLECPIKECPGCKIPTQKTFGCDHMSCSVRGCGTHWCWNCGVAFDAREIYEHMNRDHGGMYQGGDGLGDDSADEDSDGDY